ncbi:MAG: cobalt transporter CbiM [Deltaproteobacteria bacterium]|nr:cobalt transporter CbiM [Deltaproteobacteria bacterium]
MHIPDGYLSPATCGAFYAAMLPAWYMAFRKPRKDGEDAFLKAPLVALGAAFSFVIMMFNFPLPGATSAHVAGTAILAIMLGPWPAVAAVSIALLLQAVVFADGGITTYGVNAFNIALVMAVISAHVFGLLSGGRGSVRMSAIAAFIAAYLASSVSAFLTAMELGVQPILSVSDAGVPLYAPYPLKVTLTAVMAPHLLIVAPAEGLMTALVVALLMKKGTFVDITDALMVKRNRLVSAIIVLAVFTPLGLIAKDAAWGEWSIAEIEARLGYVPEGIRRWGEFWSGVIPDYTVSGSMPVVEYIASAVFGSMAIVLLMYVVERFRRKR